MSTFHKDHRDADEVLDPRAGRGQRRDHICHDSRGLGGHVGAANELAVLVDGVLPADEDHRRAGRDDGDVAEGGALDEPRGAE